jgi:hypothetical protein
VRILEALKILETATIECKKRAIDTPEVREALDVLAPYCRPEWRTAGFRDHLKPQEEFGPSGEGQQQNLRVYFSGIYSNVRQLLQTRINGLETRYRKTNNPARKAELDRLKAELERMLERWKFLPRSM